MHLEPSAHLAEKRFLKILRAERMKFYRARDGSFKISNEILKQNFIGGTRARILAMKTRNVKFSDAPSRHDETTNASLVRNTQEAMF